MCILCINSILRIVENSIYTLTIKHRYDIVLMFETKIILEP